MSTQDNFASAASFIGTWELLSFTEVGEDGRSVEPMGAQPKGFLVYTTEGIVSAQLMGSGDAEEEISLEGTVGHDALKPTAIRFIGYCGAFTVNTALQEVVHLPVVSADRAFVGKALHRRFEFVADRLMLTTMATGGGDFATESRLVWRRFGEKLEGSGTVPI
jgi:hypothetical protein